MLGRPRAGELEGVAHDPVHAAAGEDAGLDHHLLVGAFEAAAADRGILALVVLADDDEVDLSRHAVGERRPDPRHQPDGADVGVLLEAAAQPDQEVPERDMVRHQRRQAHGPEEDGLVLPDLLQPVLGHHPAVLNVVVAAPGELVPLELEAELAARRLQHADAFRHHLFADAVAGDDRDLVLGHEQLS